jgi:hypothetical protein
MDATTVDIIAEYERRVAASSPNSREWERRGSGSARLTSIEVSDAGSGELGVVRFGGSITIALRGHAAREPIAFEIAVQATTTAGMPVLYYFDQYRQFTVGAEAPFEIHVTLDNIRLMPDTYLVNVWLGRTGIEDIDYVRLGASFRVIATEKIRTTWPIDQSHGLVICDARVDRLS